MLTADAFGVLPPIARLSPEAAMYHFLSGYTAKVAGHRARRDRAEGDVQHLLRRAVHGVGSERLREAAGRPHRAAQRARVAGQHRLDRRPVRRRLAHEDRAHARDDQRGVVRRARDRAGAARSDLQPRRADRCPGVPADVLNPRNTWQDKAAYDQRRASWRRCSSTTSRRSRRRRRRRSRPRDRARSPAIQTSLVQASAEVQSRFSPESHGDAETVPWTSRLHRTSGPVDVRTTDEGPSGRWTLGLTVTTLALRTM